MSNHHVKQKLSGFYAEPTTKSSIARDAGAGMRGFSDRMPNPSISDIEAVCLPWERVQYTYLYFVALFRKRVNQDDYFYCPN